MTDAAFPSAGHVALGKADMATAADVAGKSYDRFRKIWKSLVRTQGFPAPFAERPYYWEPDRLAQWRANCSDARRHAIVTSPTLDLGPANDDHADAPPSPIRKGRAASGRARMMQRMGAHRA